MLPLRPGFQDVLPEPMERLAPERHDAVALLNRTQPRQGVRFTHQG